MLLTNKVVNDTMTSILDDKYSCHNDNKTSHSHLRGKEQKRMALENRLKEHRARLGINQSDMGKLAGVSRQTISLIERGDYSPSVTLALKLARICQVTVEDIFTYTEDEEDE